MASVARIRAIAIGASVGGVEALSVVLAGLTATLPAAVLVVLHLPRERPSLLPKIFQRITGLEVREAEDKEPIVAGTLYFAPPDYHLLVDAGPALALSVDEPVQFSRPSIDVLFESAAQVYGAGLLAVVLTGNNEDGAEGADAVHRAGGRVLVQRPETAVGPTMPAAALARVPHAEQATVAEIARLLQSLNEERFA